MFQRGDGRDTVFDFQSGAGSDDVLQLDAAAFADFNALMQFGRGVKHPDGTGSSTPTGPASPWSG